MNAFVLLDAGPLSMVTHPDAEGDNSECNQWLRALLKAGKTVAVPEIADYEIRRELLRANKRPSIERLDRLGRALPYLALTTEVMQKAARFWAEARQKHRPAADDKKLDADMILSAQAAVVAEGGNDVVIATNNVRHLRMFVPAQEWREIH